MCQKISSAKLQASNYGEAVIVIVSSIVKLGNQDHFKPVFFFFFTKKF